MITGEDKRRGLAEKMRGWMVIDAILMPKYSAMLEKLLAGRSLVVVAGMLMQALASASVHSMSEQGASR